MSVEYSMRAGYGFLLEGLEDALMAVAMKEQEDQSDAPKLFDLVKEITLAHTFELVEKFHKENSLETCSVDVEGDFVSDEGYSVVAFLNDYETVSLNGRFSEDYGAHLFDDEIPVSAAMTRDIEKMKNYFRFLNDEPKPVVSIRVF